LTSLVVCGIRGRMGSALARLAADRHDLRIAAGIAREALDGHEARRYGCERIVALRDAAAVIADADVVIDFSGAAATSELLDRAAAVLGGRGVVIGTTGLDTDTQRRLDQLAQQAAVLTAANFSIGVNLLVALAERVAGALDSGHYHAEIVETHHARKADAPSGTALALGEAVARGRGGTLAELRRDGRSGQTGERRTDEIGFHAVRGGGVVGEHVLMFLGERERIELRHEALDRSLFAEGALRAAAWVAGRAPGRYGMREVLGL
jgi:4-hydroxy-tetrahydrodipicolinate reductase